MPGPLCQAEGEPGRGEAAGPGSGGREERLRSEGQARRGFLSRNRGTWAMMRCQGEADPRRAGCSVGGEGRKVSLGRVSVLSGPQQRAQGRGFLAPHPSPDPPVLSPVWGCGVWMKSIITVLDQAPPHLLWIPHPQPEEDPREKRSPSCPRGEAGDLRGAFSGPGLASSRPSESRNLTGRPAGQSAAR